MDLPACSAAWGTATRLAALLGNTGKVARHSRILKMREVRQLAVHLAAAVFTLWVLANVPVGAALQPARSTARARLGAGERLQSRQELRLQGFVIVFTSITCVAGPLEVETVAHAPLVDAGL